METIATQIDFHQKKKQKSSGKSLCCQSAHEALGDNRTRQQSLSEIIISSFILNHLMGVLCSCELLQEI